MRRPENSPGSPAQCPAVSTTFGAMSVPEQRNAGLPAMSIMMRTTAGWAFPSSVPLVMKDGPPGFRAAVGTRSQPSRLTQAAARTGMTRRAFMVPLAGGMGVAIVTPNERVGQIAASAWALRDVGTKRALVAAEQGRLDVPGLESMMPYPVARGHSIRHRSPAGPTGT